MSVTACPGCASSELAVESGRAAVGMPTHHLVLPGIHCGACIRGVETTLNARPDISDARVNLTRKRVSVTSKPGADPTPWIEDLARAGYEAHEAKESEIRSSDDMLLHLGIAGFAMMNVMLLSVAVWSGAADSTRDFLHWVSAAIALPATAFAAQPFFKNALAALRVGRLNMDVPISLAIVLACGMSLYEVAIGGEHAWFDAALALTFFLLAGRVLDQRLRRAARSAAENLAALEPTRVLRIENGERISRPITEIDVGDRIWLAAGARVPVDATLISGTAEIDRSALTGESDAISVSRDATVHAGDIAITGPVEILATAVGEDTTLRRLTQLVSTAENARGRYHGLADRAAAIYTPAVHIISAAAFLGWLIATGDVRLALNVAVATLIITCPCALGLAVPAVAVAATSRLYQEGVLVKSDTGLERLAESDLVVFDKTGTLTKRTLTIPSDVELPHRQVLRALAEASDHPLSRELRQTLSDTAPVPVTDVSEEPGVGVSAIWNGQAVSITRAAENGRHTVFRIGETEFALESEESLLPNAIEAVKRLNALGLKTAMMTGDAPSRADAIARQLGIQEVWSEVSPHQKLKIVHDLKTSGHKVLMVGDGLNDTAAMTEANASIAPGSALEASRNAADMVVLSEDLRHIPYAVEVARTARRRIIQNFSIAALYNSIAVPIAVLGFATPLAAAIAMSTSSITVILNSIRGSLR
ncbi:MAG: heavy metal translocating P-type ATPase [Boseongicola sp.]|nr:heavy metal translocating P-type ATPase [Boseongicola sp.]MDD9978754.1 heavy metal translocating P-type ATPase [Boseongicola sp.]